MSLKYVALIAQARYEAALEKTSSVTGVSELVARGYIK